MYQDNRRKRSILRPGMHPKYLLNTVLLLLRFAYEANRILANHIRISGDPTTPALC